MLTDLLDPKDRDRRIRHLLLAASPLFTFEVRAMATTAIVLIANHQNPASVLCYLTIEIYHVYRSKKPTAQKTVIVKRHLVRRHHTPSPAHQ